MAMKSSLNNENINGRYVLGDLIGKG